MNQTILILSSVTFLVMLRTIRSLETIKLHQNITDGQTVVSGNRKFELGFFSPGNSKNRYLGIWFKNTSPHTVVWVANRETPLTDTSGMLKLDSHGKLFLVNGGGTVIWSSNSSASSKIVNYPRAQLLDTGNLVIKNTNSVIWKSFDYPGDTFISGMKVGENLVTGREMYMTSWRSADDPFPGEYTVRFLMLKGTYPQAYISKSSVILTRVGPYDGIDFAGQPNYKRYPNNLYISHMVINQNEMYYMYTPKSTTISLRTVVTPGGIVEISQLNMRNQEWTQDLTLPVDYCDNYGLCGPNGICSTATFPNCACFKGFEQTNPQQPNPDNWTSGCMRVRALDCGPEEGFLKFSSLKLPDTQNAMFNGSMSLQECEVACRNNCLCTAYANPNITAGGVGCLLWFGDLIDVRVYSQNGQDLFVRLAASELSEINSVSRSKKKGVLTVVLSTSSFAVLLFAVAYACRQKRKMLHVKGRGNWHALHKKNTSVQMEDIDKLPFFSLHE